MLKIRLANQKYLKQASELFDQYRVFYKMPSDRSASQQFILQRLINKDSIIYLAFKDNNAVGFLQIYPSFSSVAMRPTWLLNDLYINLEYRRKGLATEMLNYIEKLAKQHQIFSIKLATELNNQSAISLYENCGYKKNELFFHYSKMIN